PPGPARPAADGEPLGRAVQAHEHGLRAHPARPRPEGERGAGRRLLRHRPGEAAHGLRAVPEDRRGAGRAALPDLPARLLDTAEGGGGDEPRGRRLIQKSEVRTLNAELKSKRLSVQRSAFCLLTFRSGSAVDVAHLFDEALAAE